MTYIDFLVGGVLFLINFSIGSSLTISDFRKVFHAPRSLVIGLVLQMIGLPLLAFGIVSLTHLPPALQIGIIILAACPGGTTSNFISYLIKANAALSLSLTSINSIISLFSIPFVVSLALVIFRQTTATVTLPIASTILTILGVVLLPAALGVLTKRYAPKTIQQYTRTFKISSTLLLGVMYGIKFFASSGQGGSGITLSAIKAVFPAVLIFHLAALLLGYGGSLLGSVKRRDKATISIEVGLQNTTLAILVAGTILGQEVMTQPALVYALFSFWTAAAFGWLIMHRWHKENTTT